MDYGYTIFLERKIRTLAANESIRKVTKVKPLNKLFNVCLTLVFIQLQRRRYSWYLWYWIWYWYNRKNGQVILFLIWNYWI